MPDEATIEIERTLSRQFDNFDAASKEATAELWKRSDLPDIIQQVLEAKAAAVGALDRYRILQIIGNVIWQGLPIRKATAVVVDTIGKYVAMSPQELRPTISDSRVVPEGVDKMDSGKPERLDVATLLELPSLKDAVRAVVENQRISADPANRLAERKVLDEQGGFSLEIPRHQY